MTSPAALALAAAALFPSDEPEARRLKALRPFFTPPPGGEALLDIRELRDESHRKPGATLRGFITVVPPKGSCFTIRRRDDIRDERVCKQKRLSFQLGDLDIQGRLHWSVSTGEGDFGTPLTWQTPYRLATLVSYSQNPDDAELRYVESCEIVPRGPDKRRILVKLIGEKPWVVLLPEEGDKQLAPSKAPPNLLVTTSKAEAEAPKAAPSPPETQSSSPPKEGPSTANAAPSAPQAAGTQLNAPPPADPAPSWYIPDQGAFVMSASRLMISGHATPGSQGICRYSYMDIRQDPHTGIIECRDHEVYKLVVIPLSCLNTLKPR